MSTEELDRLIDKLDESLKSVSDNLNEQFQDSPEVSKPRLTELMTSEDRFVEPETTE